MSDIKIGEKFLTFGEIEIEKNIFYRNKTLYIDKLADRVNKYSNSYHSTMKMKPFDVNQAHILTLLKKLIIKILNLKLVILLEYQNIKIFLQKVTLQIGLKTFLWLNQTKTLPHQHVISDLNKEEIVGKYIL